MDIAIVAILAVFGVPVVAIVTEHRRKMAEIKARTAQGLSSEVRAELTEIKNQLAELRETTTKFDMSMDAAMDRLERRVERMETRTVAATAATEEQQVLSRR